MNPAIITHKMEPVFKRCGILSASLFGSAARGEARPDSDIDILVEIPPDIHGFDYITYRMDLQEDLEKVTNKKVDIVERHLIKETLKKYILAEEMPIYSQ